nr:GspH/FimT family pseudopilin [uncultured Deefgea sp.]
MPRIKYQGFTLIEMMLTVSIIAILAATALPSFTEWLQKTRVKGASEEFHTLLNYAKAEAIKNNQDICLLIENPSDNWTIKVSTTSSTCDTPVTDLRTLKSLDYRNGVVITLAADSKLNKTRFTPRTQRPILGDDATITASQSIKFSNGNSEKTVEITATGLTSLQ